MLRPTYAPELLMEADALKVILKWKGTKCRLERSVVYDGYKCTIILEPCNSIPIVDEHALTDCQADILDVLRAVAPTRLTKPKIISALDAAQKIHGVSTIAIALSQLCDRGLITRPRPGSRDGYGITDSKVNRSKT